MAKIAVGILILREGKAPEWTIEVDNGFDSWIRAYIPWLTTAKTALEEMNSAKCVKNPPPMPNAETDWTGPHHHDMLRRDTI